MESRRSIRNAVFGGYGAEKMFDKYDLTGEVWVNLIRSPPGEVFGFVENIRQQLERERFCLSVLKNNNSELLPKHQRYFLTH